MHPRSLSFRAGITAELLEAFRPLGTEWLGLVAPMTELGSMLAMYSEEGQALTPSVFVCGSAEELVARAGGGEIVRLGVGSAEDGVAAIILKRTAPLARGGWHVFVEKRKDGQIAYGVFSVSLDPSVLTVESSIFGGGGENYSAAMMRQVASNKVLLRSTHGVHVTFLFSANAPGQEIPAGTHVSKLCQAASKRVPEDSRAAFSLFLENIVGQALDRSHGALIAVVDRQRHHLDGRLREYMPVEPPIDLAARFEQHRSEPSAVTLSKLQAASELLAGFVGSDGLTMLTDDGNIAGFRCLVDTKEIEGPPNGGSRTRAFAALQAVVGKELVAAYFQSQDGRTDCVMEVDA